MTGAPWTLVYSPDVPNVGMPLTDEAANCSRCSPLQSGAAEAMKSVRSP